MTESVTDERAVLTDGSRSGLTACIYSRDYSPANICIEDRTGKILARVIIPEKEPRSTDDIQVAGIDSITHGQRMNILGILRSYHRRLRVPVWKIAGFVWEALHAED